MRYQSVSDKLSTFHEAFNCPQDRSYKGNTMADAELLVLRKNLIKEEVSEALEAIDTKDAASVLKELVDIVIVCIGMADTYGWDFDCAFTRVHRSNMSKLDDDGKPIYREDGKVLKSDNYRPPYLSDLV